MAESHDVIYDYLRAPWGEALGLESLQNGWLMGFFS